MRITKRHNEAIELLIDGELTKEQIAKSVRVSRSTLYKWLEDKDFNEEYQERLNEIERQTRARIRNMTAKALDRQEQILDTSRNDMAAASVAADVLDRAGYAPEDNVNVNTAAPVQILFDIPRNAEGGNEKGK